MILPFSQKFKDGTPTHFVEKIWNSLLMFDDFIKYGSWFAEQTVPIPLDETLLPKLHTIREDKHDRWHAGRLIHPVINNRSKDQFQFAPTFPCVSTQKIEIIRTSDYLNETIVKVDGKELDEKQVQQLAWNDGFPNLIAFWMWFSEGYTGKIIHWTNLKY